MLEIKSYETLLNQTIGNWSITTAEMGEKAYRFSAVNVESGRRVWAKIFRERDEDFQYKISVWEDGKLDVMQDGITKNICNDLNTFGSRLAYYFNFL